METNTKDTTEELDLKNIIKDKYISPVISIEGESLSTPIGQAGAILHRLMQDTDIPYDTKMNQQVKPFQRLMQSINKIPYRLDEQE